MWSMAWEPSITTWPTVDLPVLKQLASDQEELGVTKLYSVTAPLLSLSLASSNFKWG